MGYVLRKVYNHFSCVYIVMVHHVTDGSPIIGSCVISEENYCTYINGKTIVDIHDSLNRIGKKYSEAYVITVDDAMDDLYTSIYRIMKVRNLPFTAFISTELVGKGGYITKEQLVEIAADPLVTIGSHCCSHIKLNECSGEEAWYEIHESKVKLEKIIGKPVDLIAYPHGITSIRDKIMAKKAGYKYGFGVVPRRLNKLSLLLCRFQLPRYNLSNENSNPI